MTAGLGIPAHVAALLAGHSEPEPFGVFAESWVALTVFLQLQTQWQHAPAGMAGATPTGLNYGAMAAVPEVRAMKPDEYEDCFECIRILEGSWLEETHRRAEERRNAQRR